MRATDVIGAALHALRGRRKQTGLSLLGMSIGVAAVLVLSGLGEGARQYLRNQFEFIGSDVIGILPGKVETSGAVPGFGGVPNDLTIADAQARDLDLDRNLSLHLKHDLDLEISISRLRIGDRARLAHARSNLGQLRRPTLGEALPSRLIDQR